MAVNVAPAYSLDEWVSYWKSKGAADVTWATDGEPSVARQFRVTYLGTTIIIDRQGRISYRDAGATPYETLKVEIEAIL